MAAEERHEVVIVGGGPAGVSAALECFDIRLDVVVLEATASLGGQLAEVPNSVRNVASGRFEDGAALQAALQEAATILSGLIRRSARVSGANLDDRWVEADGRRFAGKALLVASGSHSQQLPEAPDGAFGGDVTYHLETQLDRLAGRDTVVIGGGDSATLDALELARRGSRVTLVHRSPGLTARENIVRAVRADGHIEDLGGWELDSARGGERLEDVVLVNRATGARRVLAARCLVVKIARVPSTDFLRGQLELDRHGAVVVDSDLRSSRDGVFAAGDVVSGSYPRVATAFGQGVLAARSLLRFIQGRP